MNCWKCGNELKPGARFCPSCGADQTQAPNDLQLTQEPPVGTPPGGDAPGGSAPASNGGDVVLKVFAAVCAVIYGIMAVRGLIGVFTSLFSIFTGFGFGGAINTVLTLVGMVLDLVMCLVMVMFIFKRTPQNSDGLLVILACCGVGVAVVQFLRMVIRLIFFYGTGANYIGQFFLSLLGAAVVVAGVYCILRFVMGELPLVGKSQEELKAEVRATLDSLGKTAGEMASGAKASMDAKQQARQAQQQASAQQAAQWQAQQQTQWQAQNPGQPGPYGQPQPGPYGQPQPGPYGQPGAYNQPTPPAGGGYPVMRLKADRSLLAYILLSIVTCGIYSYYFIYSIARDVNIACAGDGKKTAGLVKFILLSIVTCGIYSWIWYYSLGNRLAENAPRYGLNFQENGTTVLLWFLFGSLLCGIGPFIAMNIIIKNTNTICGAYNYQHGI